MKEGTLLQCWGKDFRKNLFKYDHFMDFCCSGVADLQHISSLIAYESETVYTVTQMKTSE